MGQINIGSLDISYAKPEKAAGQKEAKDVTGDFKKLLGDGAKQEVDSQSGNETKLQSGQDTAEGTANDSAPDSGKSEEMLLGMQMGQFLWGMQNVQNLQNQQPAEVTPEAEAVIKPEAVNGIPGQIAAEEISAEDMITGSQNAPEQPTEEVKPEFVWEVPVKEASVNEKPQTVKAESAEDMMPGNQNVPERSTGEVKSEEVHAAKEVKAEVVKPDEQENTAEPKKTEQRLPEQQGAVTEEPKQPETVKSERAEEIPTDRNVPKRPAEKAKPEELHTAKGVKAEAVKPNEQESASEPKKAESRPLEQREAVKGQPKEEADIHTTVGEEVDMTVISREHAVQPTVVKEAEIPVKEVHHIPTQTMEVAQPEEIPQKLPEKILTELSHGVREFEIQVEPEHLGKIAIKVHYEENQTIVSIACSEKHTLDMLGKNAREIGGIMERNLGAVTEVYVDEKAQDYLNQKNDENDHAGREAEQDRQREENRKRESDDSGQFLQKLRLGLAG